VGLRDHLKLIKAWTEDAYESSPKFARITGVGRKVGPVTTIELEVHIGDREPFDVSTLQFVPRRVKPKVGQDVAVRETTGDNHTGYIIDWDKPPQYGQPRRTDGDLERFKSWAQERGLEPPEPKR
jgi:hypothetical protein